MPAAGGPNEARARSRPARVAAKEKARSQQPRVPAGAAKRMQRELGTPAPQRKLDTYDGLSGAEKRAYIRTIRPVRPQEAAALQHVHNTRVARNADLKALSGRLTHQARESARATQAPDSKALTRDEIIAQAGAANLRHRQGETARQVLNTAGPNSFDKVLAPLRKQTKSTALSALDQLSRPVHGVAGAVLADVKDIKAHGVGSYLTHVDVKQSLRAAGRGLANKDKVLFSDVLKEAGAPKWAQATAGFALDVALDPTTYITLGVGVPAKVAAKGAEAAVLKAGREAVKAGQMTQIELERKALATAKKVYDDHPQHAKHLGLRVGVRGAPVRAVSSTVQAVKHGSLKEGRARATRQVMSQPMGSRVTQAARKAARGATTESARTLAADVLDRAGQQFIHDYRPRDRHVMVHDYMRTAARRYRTAREAGDRHAQSRARVIHKAVKDAKLGPDDEATIIHAFESGTIRNLPDHMKPIAVAIERDLAAAGQAEIDKGLRHTLDIKGPAPHVPPPADVAAARDALKAAVKEAKSLEEFHLKSLQGYGVARGRASILSRQVGGSKAEHDAELRSIFAGGGHGEAQAREALGQSLAAVHAARLKVADLKTRFADTLAADGAHEAGVAATAAHALKPSGYFPRHVKDEVWDAAHQRYASPHSGGQSITGTSLQARSREQALEHMTPAEIAQYDLRIAPNVGRRLQEHGRAIALSDYHDRLASLGHKVASLDDLKAGLTKYPDAVNRLFVRTPKGFKLLTDKYGAVDMGKAAKAFRDGHEVVEVPTADYKQLEDLRQRGRSAGETDHNVATLAFDKMQGTIKTLQTAVNPGYHGTNLVGDTFNARLGGALATDFTAAARLHWVKMGMDKAERQLNPQELARVKRAATHSERYGDQTFTDAEVVHLAMQTGADSSGFAGHELPELLKGKDISTNRGAMDRLRAFSEHRENLVRMATFHGALKRGLTPDEAAEWVSKHHFDYGDLTNAERSFARRVVPFYTFMARNTRLQVGALGRSPGTYATYGKARDELAKASDMDPDFARTLQEFEQQGVPLPLPIRVGGNPAVLFPKMPLTDLNNVTNNPATAFNNLVGRMSVMFKVPIEQGLQLNTFTRSQYTKDRVPAPGALRYAPLRAAVNNLFQQAGIFPAVKDIEDPRTGQMVPGWSWRVDELLRQVPFTNVLAKIGTDSRNGHPQDPYMTIIGYVLGPRPAILDPKQVSLNQLWDQHQKLDEQIKSLKQTVRHKSGAKWGGNIAKMNKRLGKLEVNIAKTAKSMGVADPAFANRIGGSSKKRAAQAFGAAGGPSSSKPRPFGATP